MISTFYNTYSVLIVFAITAFVCLGVTIFSFQTKYDLTSCFGILYILSLVLLGFGIACIINRSEVSIENKKDTQKNKYLI